MSVRLVPKPDGYMTTRKRALLDAVDEAVFDDSTVCPQCFARLRHVHSDDDLIEAIDSEDKDRYGARKRYEETTGCRNCGELNGRGGTSLSTSKALERVPALAARLQEADLQVDVDAIFDTVRERKADSEETGKDKAIARDAALAGLRAAGTDPRSDP